MAYSSYETGNPWDGRAATVQSNPFYSSGFNPGFAEDTIRRQLAEKQAAVNNAAWRNWLGQGTATASSQEVPDPTLVSQVKNPDINAVLRNTVTDVGKMSVNPNVRQGSLQSYTKSGAVQSAIDKALAQWNLDTSNSAQSVADFTKNWMASQGQARANAEQEAGALGRIYSGEYAGDLAATRTNLASRLAAIRNAERTGATQNLQRRLGGIALQAKLGSLAGGTDSYLNAQTLDAAQKASIAHDLALAEMERKDVTGLAGMEREDIANVLGNQMKAAGMRQTLLDNAIKRGLVPAEVANQLSTQDLQRLSSISGLWNNNTYFDFQTSQDLMAKKLAALGALTNISNANTLYGLKQPSIPDSRGWLPIGAPPVVRNPGGGGGGYYPGFLGDWGGSNIPDEVLSTPTPLTQKSTPSLAPPPGMNVDQWWYSQYLSPEEEFAGLSYPQFLG